MKNKLLKTKLLRGACLMETMFENPQASLLDLPYIII